ncbi:MAG: primosomal protein N' [Bradymonadales bacterium]|nr:primosomal protein N' [Bradymonadales bacterium]
MTGSTRDVEPSEPPRYVEVVVDLPVRSTFTYAIPDPLVQRIQPGQRLLVPFRGRPRTGVALALHQRPDEKLAGTTAIQAVLDLLEAEPALPEPLIRLLDWMARYYFAPWGEALRLMLPQELRTPGKRTVKATPFGLRCLQNDLLPDPIARSVLELLAGRSRPIADQALRREVKRLTYARLSALEEKGLVALEVVVPDSHRGVQLVHFLEKLMEPPSASRIGRKQREVLDLLEGRKRVELAEIRRLTGASLQTIHSLVERGWVEEATEERYRDPFAEDQLPPEPDRVQLTDEQQAAIAEIVGDGLFDAYRSAVLHGITGSGKTEVYLESIAAAARVGRTAILLLPEIALTPQLVRIFRSRFGDQVAVLHSALTQGERFDQWRRIRRGEVQVAIGARSVIFAPFPNLGIVVVDEEHDGSFKQDSGVRYHARDLAMVRGQLEKAVVVLGSATPSLESYHRAEQGKSRLLVLRSRPTGQPLPTVEIVDLRQVPPDAQGRPPILSGPLRQALVEVVQGGQQAILFLNRRGHSPAVVCQSCGHDWKCPHCEITLTYHRRADQLRCHYCDFSMALPPLCPTCASPEWVYLGTGTEKLADRIADELEGFRVARLDRDTATAKNIRQIIRHFASGQADVLVGTQMVTKGHDFPNVNLVGVVMADLSLRIPDFRSGERTFQLLTQVSGRAGRRDTPGRVIIQTYLPDNPVIQAAARQDYQAFAAFEMSTRRQLGYPPFGYLVGLRFESADLEALQTVAERYRLEARRILGRLLESETDQGQVTILGPVEAPLAMLKGRHRWQMLIRSSSRSTLRRFVARLLSQVGFDVAGKAVQVIVDVDPMQLM